MIDLAKSFQLIGYANVTDHACHASFLFQALLMAWQEREIQLKMLIGRGESVQKNTSPAGVPLLRQQIQELKDSWDALLSASIQCKRSVRKGGPAQLALNIKPSAFPPPRLSN